MFCEPQKMFSANQRVNDMAKNTERVILVIGSRASIVFFMPKHACRRPPTGG
jgi:hypothetical protein